MAAAYITADYVPPRIAVEMDITVYRGDLNKEAFQFLVSLFETADLRLCIPVGDSPRDSCSDDRSPQRKRNVLSPLHRIATA